MSRGYHVVLSGDSYSVVAASIEEIEVASDEVAQCPCGSALEGECEECDDVSA